MFNKMDTDGETCLMISSSGKGNILIEIDFTPAQGEVKNRTSNRLLL